MQFLTLTQLKAQCKVEHDDENEHLEFLGTTAEQAVQKHLNRNLYAENVPAEDDTGLLVSKTHQMAMLLMVGQLYENREATTELSLKEVPLAYHYLLQFDRIIPV